MTFLQRLLPGDEHASLLGDIQEEAQRRSRLWYWWQLATVLVVCSNRDARKHPLLVLRAIVIGFVTLLIYQQTMTFAILSKELYVGHYWLLRISGVVTIIALGFALSGWMVVRANRSFGITMVVPYVRVICVIEFATLVWADFSVRRTLPPVDAISAICSFVAMTAVAVFAGAMLGTRRRPVSHA